MAAMRMNAQLKPTKEPPKVANDNSKKETEREQHPSFAAA
jgi:hypothetical protein